MERVREILKISQEPVSLETPIGEEEDSHLQVILFRMIMCRCQEMRQPSHCSRTQLVEVLTLLTETEGSASAFWPG